jgi:hypothetical protein
MLTVLEKRQRRYGGVNNACEHVSGELGADVDRNKL